MHKIYTFTVAALVAGGISTASFAGGLTEPEVTPEVIIAETTKSASDDWVVPFMTLLLLATAASTH